MPNPTTWREVTAWTYTAELARQSAARKDDSPSHVTQRHDEVVVSWWKTREPIGKTRRVDGAVRFYLVEGESDE